MLKIRKILTYFFKFVNITYGTAVQLADLISAVQMCCTGRCLCSQDRTETYSQEPCCACCVVSQKMLKPVVLEIRIGMFDCIKHISIQEFPWYF